MNTGELRWKELSIVFAVIFVCAFLLGFSTQNGGLIIPGNVFLSPTAWDDLRVPLSTTRNPSDAPGYGTFKNGTLAFAFDKTTDEMLYFETQIPHNYKLGTNLDAHIHWAPSDTGVGGVVWCLEYTIQYPNAAFGATTTDCARQIGSGTAYQHQLIDIEVIAGITGSISAVIIGRVFRDANSSEGKGTDDYDADAFGLSFDIHYQIDSFGSRQETMK